MGSAFIQKLIWTVLALGVWALSAVPYFAAAAAAFHTAAGVIFGAVWINAKESACTSVRPPPAPAKPGDWLEPLVPIVVLLLASQAVACATWADVKPALRDANVVARELCEATMGAEAERQGLPIREFCAISYIIAPFLEAQHLAAANAKLGRELTVHECVQ